MKKIVIVDAVSTGYNYVEDVWRRGYDPVILEPAGGAADLLELRRSSYALFRRQPEVIKEAETYEETLKKVKEYDPILVLPGSEGGVPLATHLADDLGLPGNPWANIDKMIKKDAMQQALADAGIRSIRGRNVKSVDEAMDFCHELGLNCAVVKPLRGAGSVGLYLCDDLDEVKAAVSELMSADAFFGGGQAEALIQERIIGTEYIVNTVTCDGVHRVTAVLRYKKFKTAEGGYIYSHMETITRLEPGHTAMVEYALKVADAIGIRYGMVHGEYMLDENGPVLIEVNCRPMGCTQPDEYMDLIYGQHETDSTLDAILDPEKFRREAAKPYRPLRKGALKFIMVPEDMEAEDTPLWQVAKHLRSTYKISADSGSVPRQYIKTRDLESAGGLIYLVHDDESVVNSDIDLLNSTEQRFFQLIINDGMSRRWFIDDDETDADFAALMKRNSCCGSVLIARDSPERIEGVQVVTPDTLSDAHGSFDYVIIGYRKSLVGLSESKLLELIFDTMDQVREGGKVIIPPETYRHLSYGREGAEELLYLRRFLIDVPQQNMKGEVTGTRADR